MELATVTCALCGRSFEKPARRVRARNSCCAAHARKWNAQRLADYNRLENPLNQPGGVVSNRRKRREALSGTGEGKAYRKFYGRHEHRAVAEAMLGSPCGPARWYTTGTATGGSGSPTNQRFVGVRATTPPISKSSRRNRSM